MATKRKTRTEQILTILKILAWMAFLGFVVKAGAYFLSYLISCYEPESAKNLYKGYSLYELFQYNFGFYSLMVLVIVALSSMKAVVWYMVAKMISKIELRNPFTKDVAHRLEYISYFLFITAGVALIGSIYSGWLEKTVGNLHERISPGEFLFMAGLVFIISQIFKRGVEIQNENDLTV